MERKELLAWQYFALYLGAHNVHCHIEAYCLVSKTAIFMYHQNAYIVILDMFTDHVRVQQYSTVDFEDPHEAKLEISNGLSVDEFLKKYPKDDEYGDFREHEISFDGIIEKLQKKASEYIKTADL